MGSIGSNLDANSVLLAFGLTLFAGLSTGIGGLVTIFWKKINAKIISIVLGFSAGVMIYLSFMEILHEAKDFLINHLGKPAGLWVTMAAFFGGVLIIAIIDKLIPSAENPHESHKIEEMQSQDSYCSSSKLLRTGLSCFSSSQASYPALFIALLILSISTIFSSYSTSSFSVAKLTLAEWTPSNFPTLLSIAFAQAVHVIPLITILCFFIGIFAPLLLFAFYLLPFVFFFKYSYPSLNFPYYSLIFILISNLQ
jgi:zinc transporter ZupT